MKSRPNVQPKGICKPHLLGPLLLLLALALPSPLWAEVRASLDRTQVYQGDTLTLTIEVEGTSAPQPDLSALNQEFEVLGTTSGIQINILNGRRSDTTRWQISLRPRSTGELRIPPLSLGAERSPALTLRVADTPSIPQRDGEVLVELEADLSGGIAYVQQQVPLRVRLYSALPLRQGTLSDPQVEAGVLERLGEDKRYTTERGGKRYQVLERRYVLSPEQSGTLHIPPVVFKGNLPVEPGTRSTQPSSPFDRLRKDPFFDRFFDGAPFGRFFEDDPFLAPEPGRPVTVRSEGLELQVRPKPSAAGAPWLPAEDLVVEDSWASKTPDLRVGEPATRTLTLRARGLSGSQIPQIPLAAGDSVRLYPEAPRHETRTDGNLIYGTSQQAFAFIPQQAGPLRLPEIRVRWWDTRADQQREAIVPAIEALVQSAPSGLTPAAPSPATPISDPQALHLPTDQPKAQGEPLTPSGSPKPWWWNPWLLGGSTLALLAASLVWLGRRRQPASAQTTPAPKPPPLERKLRPDPEPSRRAFQSACDANDAAAAARNLLAWAAAQWPQGAPRSLVTLANSLVQGGEAVLDLERALYGDQGADWQGAPLKAALAGGLIGNRRAPDQPEDGGLAPLYPWQA